ncbi:sensor histidine kinase [Domibacillus epiphyticus]|uniref:histidine kinase n=1 Tax=Domibacillus epiphyticus TaxID=1714355 RepID=A0A1V2ABC9_9BACI|nr:ATP-binding protein [Domibacillus epiphyticus]OMP68305.1 hypothetical protein BTO28_02520 [Domibacillus epiphyticus]
MNYNGIVLKLGTTIMILFLSVLLPLGFFTDRIFLSVYSSQVHQKVNDLSRELVDILDEPNERQSDYYQKLSKVSGKELVIFDGHGKIVTNSNMEFKKGDNISSELLHILKHGQHFERNYVDNDTKEQFFIVGRPLMKGETFQGGIIVFSSIEEIHNIMHSLRNWIVMSIIGAVLLALGFTLFVSRKLSSPLIKMEQATRQIAKGQLDTEVQIKTRDEVGSLAQAINDLSVELNHYRKNRSELLANISHELRTPISYLRGYAQLIKLHRYRDKQELESYSAVIESESIRLAKLIEDLFELSKMEEGRINLYLQPVDVGEIIEQSIQKVTLKAKEKNLGLEYKIDQELPLIYSDGTRIQQVLFNLLENAVSYTEEGKVTVKALWTADFISISVTDTGNGIPNEDLPFIFDRFHRVEKSRSREMGGSGLGLAIVSEIVKLLKGSISVKSENGKGTEFLLKLPVK